MKREVINTPHAPAAIGPYSQAIQVGKTLYCSGQIPIDPKTNIVLTDADIENQTIQVLENIGAVLKASGMSNRDVARCEVFLASMDDFAQMNEVYSRYFNESPPARVTVEVSKLPRGVKVEISCIAAHV
ncbi:MAG TPA: reactive intermediate/imine deaminase [Bacteroidetes bacterium]|nr:reactive intermediate/imine deaminase [Bacteroidota bacterium]